MARGQRIKAPQAYEVRLASCTLSTDAGAADMCIMSRSARFVVELTLAAAASQAVSGFVFAGATFTEPGGLEARGWFVRLVAVFLQWLVMRRHVGWATPWALAWLVDSPLFAMASTTSTWFPAWISTSVRVAIWTTFARGLPQWIVLSSRAPRSWVWLVVPAVQVWAGELVRALTGAGGMSADGSLTPSVAVRAAAVVTSAFGAIVLAWLCREQLSGEAPPEPLPATRREFLVSWVAVHTSVVGLASLTSMATSSTAARSLIAALTLPAMLVGGQWLALSLVPGTWRRWVLPSAIVAGAWVALSLVGFGLSYYLLLATRTMALGFTLGLAQWFAVRDRSWGIAWLVATVVGWTAFIWVPQLGRLLVGAANLWRFPINDPTGYYAVCAVITGLALSWEWRRHWPSSGALSA